MDAMTFSAVPPAALGAAVPLAVAPGPGCTGRPASCLTEALGGASARWMLSADRLE